MIYSLLVVLFFSVLTSFYLYRRSRYWHLRYLNTGINTELELATMDQVINELRSRPQSSFVMLEPHEGKEGLLVTTYACNVRPEVILASLKAAHDGVVEHLGIEENE